MAAAAMLHFIISKSLYVVKIAAYGVSGEERPRKSIDGLENDVKREYRLCSWILRYCAFNHLRFNHADRTIRQRSMLRCEPVQNQLHQA